MLQQLLTCRGVFRGGLYWRLLRMSTDLELPRRSMGKLTDLTFRFPRIVIDVVVWKDMQLPERQL
jgi:hypothetical protein